MRPAPEVGVTRRADERGVFTVLFAFVITVLMLMLAIVIDLGNMRSMRRDVQSEVDLAALAAGEKLRTFDAISGCSAAVRYLRINIADLPSGTAVPCGSLPTTCDDAGTAPMAVDDAGTAAPWTVRITYPVADAAIADPDVAGTGLRTDDGTPCERIKVEVTRTTKGYFSSFAGMETYGARASAVARRTHDLRTRVPSLWLLEPFECNAFTVTGTAPATGAKVRVGSPTLGGLITLDSSGTRSCTGSARTIDVQANDAKLYLEVFPPSTDPPGEITLFALRSGQTRCNQTGGNPTACDQSDVDEGRMTPQPSARTSRATRALVDHVYNCLASYPRYPDNSGITLAGCTSGREPYVKTLRDAVAQGMTFTPPTGFNVWSAAGYSCNDAGGVPAEGLAGNWWVDCPGGLTLSSKILTFTGGNVVFTGGIQLSGGALRVNTANPNPPLPSLCQSLLTGCLDRSSPEAAFLYVRGDIKSSGQGTIDIRRTAVIQDNGTLSLQGQSPPRWTSAKEGPFRNLSLWSEQAGSGYKINGGADMLLEGIFFTPFAYPFEISGGGGQGALQAQFISRTLKISGGGTLWLEPAGAGFIHLPPAAAVLIR